MEYGEYIKFVQTAIELGKEHLHVESPRLTNLMYSPYSITCCQAPGSSEPGEGRPVRMLPAIRRSPGTARTARAHHRSRHPGQPDRVVVGDVLLQLGWRSAVGAVLGVAAAAVSRMGASRSARQRLHRGVGGTTVR